MINADEPVASINLISFALSQLLMMRGRRYKVRMVMRMFMRMVRMVMGMVMRMVRMVELSIKVVANS